MRNMYLLLLFLLPLLAQAQSPQQINDTISRARVEQKLDAPLPLELEFVNDAGEMVQLGRYFGSQPVVIAPVWYSCPNLCGLPLRGLVGALKEVDFSAGQDYQVVAISIDPHDGPKKAAALKAELLRSYDRAGAADGWHLLTGTEPAVRELTQALGFGYSYDPHNKQYAHPAALVLSGSDGRINRYLQGVVFPPQDLRLGLLESAQGKLGSLVDQVIMRCYGYDPVTGTYSFMVTRALQMAGSFLVLLLGGGILLALWRERRQRA